MDEQRIIPAVEEAAAEQLAAEKAELPSFISEFEQESLPACDEGMLLLMNFARDYPAAFGMARNKNFIDPPPFLKANPGWSRFSKHFNQCHKCNESGPNEHPFTYELKGPLDKPRKQVP